VAETNFHNRKGRCKLLKKMICFINWHATVNLIKCFTLGKFINEPKTTFIMQRLRPRRPQGLITLLHRRVLKYNYRLTAHFPLSHNRWGSF